MSRINLLFVIVLLDQTKEGVVGAFEECTKVNRGYLVAGAACFQLHKAYFVHTSWQQRV